MLLCLTEHSNRRSPFQLACSNFLSSCDGRVIDISQENPAVSPQDYVLTDSIRGIAFRCAKTVLYISSEDGTPFLEPNMALRRQLMARQDVEIFCPSVYMARIMHANYQIKAKIQYPYVDNDDVSDPRYVMYNRHSEVISVLEEELPDEDFVQCNDPSELSLAKLYIHVPFIEEVYNVFIPIAGSWGVPCVTEDRGCLAEMVLSGDKILYRNSDIKQWVKSVKESLRDRDSNAKMTKDASKKWSNLDALAARVKAQAEKRAVKKLNEPPKKLKERVAEAMQVRNLQNRHRGKGNKVSAVFPEPPVHYQKSPPVKHTFIRNDYHPPAEIFYSTPYWFDAHPEHVDVSIIVPLFRSAEVVSQQIRNWDVMSDDGLVKEIIYVDDSCPDNSSAAVVYAWDQFRNTWNNLRSVHGGPFNKHIGTVIRLDKNCGFATACNVGAKHARGKHLIFLNADTIVTPEWVGPMIDVFSQRENVGIVGNMQLKQDGTIDSAGSEWFWQTRTFEHIGRNVYHGKRLANVIRFNEAPQDLLELAEREMVTGCCFAIPKSLFEEVGGFDIGYRIAYWEDSDLNMKVREKGYKVYFQPKSIIYHKTGHTQAGVHPYMPDNARLFYSRWVDNGKIHQYVNAKL